VPETALKPIEQLETFGPDRCETLGVEPARAWCRRLALGRYENFSVLSRLVPPDRRDDFAAVYAFCRWADDLGDETGSPDRSLELLAWWRRELDQCFAGEPRHPVFIALAPTIERFDLPPEPFGALITAFEQDQRVRRYDTWAGLLDYCRGSADPVGRLVLMLCEEPREPELLEPSDAVCTALQLTNHLQDVRRDIVERDRIYLPRELVAGDVDRFEADLVATARQGWAVNHEILERSRAVVRACVERTWPLFGQGDALLARVRPETRPIVWLFLAGGQHVLRKIELWNYETAVQRPRLGRATRALLVARAWMGARRRRAAGAS
jgi:squalene synthase HpnC